MKKFLFTIFSLSGLLCTTGWVAAGAKSVIRWSFYRDDCDAPDTSCANCGLVDGIQFEQQSSCVPR